MSRYEAEFERMRDLVLLKEEHIKARDKLIDELLGKNEELEDERAYYREALKELVSNEYIETAEEVLEKYRRH